MVSALRPVRPSPRASGLPPAAQGSVLTIKQHTHSPVLAENLPALQWGLRRQNSTGRAHEMGMGGAGKADGAGTCNNQQYGGVFTLQKGFLPHVKSTVHGQVLTVQSVNSSAALKIFVIKWKKSNHSMLFTENRNIKNKIGMPVIRRYRGARGAEWQPPFQSEATG